MSFVRRWMAAACTVFVGLAASPVASAEQDPRIERAAALVAEAAPVDGMFIALLESNPTWPLSGFENKVTSAQISCTRGKMTRERYLIELRSSLVTFMRTEPDVFQNGIDQLEGGTAALIGKLFKAGADRGIERKAVTGKVVTQVVDELTAQEKGRVVDFTMSPKYSDARRLVGLDGNLSDNAHRLGEALAIKRLGPMLLGAMSECGIATSVLFE